MDRHLTTKTLAGKSDKLWTAGVTQVLAQSTEELKPSQHPAAPAIFKAKFQAHWGGYIAIHSHPVSTVIPILLVSMNVPTSCLFIRHRYLVIR